MDVRQQQLIAAADAVRAWVHSQRATWDNPYLYTTMPVARTVPALPVSRATVAVESPADIALPEPTPVPTLRIRDAIDRISSNLGSAVHVAWPSWRVATAAVLVLLTAGLAPLFVPRWTRTIKQEIAVGRQVVETGRTVVANGRRVVDVGREVVQKGRQVVGAAVAPAAAANAVQPTGSLQLESDPVGARIFIDGRDRGVTPLTVDDLPPGTYNVVFRAGAGSVQHRVVVTAGQTTKVADGIFSGWLRVIAPMDVLVSEGTRGLQLDDSGQVLLAPGAHDIVIENRSLGFRELHHVNVRPGATATIAVELPSATAATATEPTVTEPAAIEPAGTEPAAIEPASTEPAATEPGAPAIDAEAADATR